MVERFCEHKNIIFSVDNKNEWWCIDCNKSNPQPPTPADKLGVHLQHCNFGEHKGECKYGNTDCPALTEGWRWFGEQLQTVEKRREERDQAKAECDRAYAELHKGAAQFHALEDQYNAVLRVHAVASRLLYKYGGFPAVEELLEAHLANKHEADDGKEYNKSCPEKGCQCKRDDGVNANTPGGMPWSRF